MLRYEYFYLTPYALSPTDFYLEKCIFPYKLRWMFMCLPASMNAFGTTGIRRMLSQVETRQKGIRDQNLSSQVLKTTSNKMNIEEVPYNVHGASAYDTAMEALSSLITSKRRGDLSPLSGKYGKLDRMLMHIKILDLEKHIGSLKTIHVAGTKGKGSTCSFCDAILRECGFKTGLFTSPHLIDVRERFRLDGLDISEEKFLHYFWTCWQQLKAHVTDDLPMPPLFQFLTLLALKIFACEEVDVAIIEVGLGGTNDSTNAIKNPVVCGISSLGMDHMEILGNDLGQIASHKAGIFKPQVPAFTVPQLSEAMNVLKDRAKELKVPLQIVNPLDHKKLNGVRLSLSGDHQLINAGLAVALCKSWLQSTGHWEKLQHVELEESLPEPFLKGLSTARLSGRAQIFKDSTPMYSDTSGVVKHSGDLIFYLDGAHSPESMEACARWFSSAVKEDHTQSSVSPSCSEIQIMEGLVTNGSVQQRKNKSEKFSKQILLFNCMEVRDPQILLPTLVDTCASSGTYFSKAIFVPSISTYSKVTSGSSVTPPDIPSKDLTWQFNLQNVWERIIHGKDIHCKDFVMEIPGSKLPSKLNDQDVSAYSSSSGCFNCSAVVSSLPSTINWLREHVKQNPSLRIQVLVTGSLHLVGDVLKLLQRRPTY